MKNLCSPSLLIITCLFLSTTITAQVANDDCFGAQALGTLGVPAACPSGLGAVSTFNGLTNVNSISEQPYTTLINCQPSGVIPMASPATDVWYSFVNNGNAINITINGNIQNPNLGLYTGNCNGLIGRGCAYGGGGALAVTFDQMVVGQTYYLQISGGDVLDQGSFTMTLQNTNSCVDCLLSSSLTVNPPPNAYGNYTGGTPVTFCYTITQWEQENTNWLHGVVPSFGAGWNLATLGNFQAAATCDGSTGVWDWFTNVNTPDGNVNGFFFDGDLIQEIIPDGDPTNNFGDNCQGTVNWTFCWTITTQTCPPGVNGADLGVTVDTYGDGETGNWTNVACTNDPVYQFISTLACCTPPVMADVDVLCFGNSTGTATATGQGAGPFDYVWTNAANVVIQTTNNQVGPNTVSNLAVGTYTVTVTDQSNGCVTTGTVTITQPTQLQTVIASTGATCNQSNGTATVTPQGGVGPYDFVWTDASNLIIQTANNQPGANTANNLAAGNYNITVTDNNGCTATVAVNVQGVPGNLQGVVAGTNATCSTLCDGSATVTLNGGTANYNYVWTDAGGAVVANSLNSASATNTANALCVGTYTVTFTDANNCSSSLNVVIGSPPAVTAVVPAATICLGQNTTLTATPGGGSGAGYTYAWTPAGTGNTQSVTVTPVVTTVYTVTVTDGNNCASLPVNVTVTVTPALNVNLITAPAVICVGENSTLTAIAGGGNGGPYSYAWTPAGTGGNSPTVAVNPATSTNYTVTVSDGCTTPSATAQTTITVNPLPVVTFTGLPLAGCVPLTVNFTNTTAGSVDCLWDFGNGNTSTSCGPQVTEIFTTANCFDISLTVTDNNGCPGTLTQPAYVCGFENVNVNFYATPQPTDIFEPTITFTDLSSGMPTSWDWTFGPFGTSNVQNPIFDFPPESPGCYDVILTANNVNNCPDTDTIRVCVNPNFSIYFPNAFTPNSDSYNNRFNGKGEGIIAYDMWIFDRWGNMVFHSTGLNDPWDGRMEGRNEICLDDVYVWKAKVIDIFNREHEYLGHVTLIR